MEELIVRGRAVVIGVAADSSAEIVEGGAVLVRNSRVAEVGTFESLRAAHPDCLVVGSERNVVTPGFVNGHHHVGLTPFQLGAPDLPLELWLAAKIGLRDVDPYLDTLYSAFEMIASGVTTVQHLHVSRSSARAVEAQAEAILRAYCDIGMRVSYSYGYRDQNRLVYESDETFLSRLPSDLAEELRPWFDNQRIPIADHIALFEDLLSRHAGTAGGRVVVQLAPSNMHWCSDQALGAIGEIARKHGLPMHLHLLETAYQKVYAHGRAGKTAVAHLDDLGLLGPDMTLGHAVWVDSEDIERIGASGTCICHIASSNLRLRSGIAPCNQFLRRGIPIAIGIDEAGINDDRDMLQEMRLVLRLHRRPGMNPADVPSALEVFRMATEYGARTTPYRGTIGRLAPGMAADIVLFDWETIAGPYLDADVPPIDAIIYRAKQNAVRLVMVGGRTIYEDGRFVCVDRDAVSAEIRHALARPLSEQESRRRSMARALSPYVQGVYDGWNGAGSCHLIDGYP